VARSRLTKRTWPKISAVASRKLADALTKGVREVRVAGAAKLDHGCAVPFSFADADGDVTQGFIMRYTEGPVDALVAYRNWCPHIGTDLDMGTERFYSRNVNRIYCRTHGARFQVITGVCDFGPCVGLHLEAYALRVDGDDVVVTVSKDTESADASAADS